MIPVHPATPGTASGGAAERLAPALAGYRSVPDYIYGITREIWEDRGVGGKLAKYYAADIIVRAPTGLTMGDGGVTAQTLQTLHQFPNRQLVGEDVIWTEAPGTSFLSSHRLVSVMTHTGDGALGPARNAAIRARVIADCWVQDGQVKEEWLVRDQAAFARCLGMETATLAQQLVAADLAAGRPVSFFLPAHDKPARYVPVVADDPAVACYADGLRQIWGGKALSAIRDLYFHGATLHGPGNNVYYGTSEIDRFAVGYLASFPDAIFTVHGATVNRDPEQPVRVALRWSLDGAHSGHGHFGPPTGALVHIMGISHAYLTAGQVRTEWLLTDEVSIWKQILAHREQAAR